MWLFGDYGCFGSKFSFSRFFFGFSEKVFVDNDIHFQTGACLVYTPEKGITLDTLRNDVKYLKKRYSLDIKGKNEGRIVIK